VCTPSLFVCVIFFSLPFLFLLCLFASSPLCWWYYSTLLVLLFFVYLFFPYSLILFVSFFPFVFLFLLFFLFMSVAFCQFLSFFPSFYILLPFFLSLLPWESEDHYYPVWRSTVVRTCSKWRRYSSTWRWPSSGL
jgi:hypothetical protein